MQVVWPFQPLPGKSSSTPLPKPPTSVFSSMVKQLPVSFRPFHDQILVKRFDAPAIDHRRLQTLLRQQVRGLKSTIHLGSNGENCQVANPGAATPPCPVPGKRRPHR